MPRARSPHGTLPPPVAASDGPPPSAAGHAVAAVVAPSVRPHRRCCSAAPPSPPRPRCTRAVPPPPSRASPASTSCSITIDTLRADAVGAYGATTRRHAAASTAWPRAACVFRQAHAHNVVTLPSHANILSGRLPFQHGVRDNAGFRFPADAPTLATLLKAAGYRTGAFVSAFTLDSRFGLDRGFDVYDDQPRRSARAAGPARAPRRRHRGRRAASGCAQGDGRPTLLLDPPLRPARAVRAAGAVRFAPSPAPRTWARSRPRTPPSSPCCGRCWRRPRRARSWSLTADHGESLGEHGERTHGLFAYEATLRVPLILFAPGRGAAGGRGRAWPATSTSCPPSSTRWRAGAAPRTLPGQSLLARAAGGPRPGRRRSTSRRCPPPPTAAGRRSTACCGAAEKYIELPLPELYDLADGPGRAAQPRRVAVRAASSGCRRTCGGFPSADSFQAACAPRIGETREALRALGYLASAAAAPAEALRAGRRSQAAGRPGHADGAGAGPAPRGRPRRRAGPLPRHRPPAARHGRGLAADGDPPAQARAT